MVASRAVALSLVLLFGIVSTSAADLPAALTEGPVVARWSSELARAVERAAVNQPLAVIAQFVDFDARESFVPLVAGRDLLAYEVLPAAAFYASPIELASWRTGHGMTVVELDGLEPVNLPTAVSAIRADRVWGAHGGGPIEVNGRIIDGTGVGVAVVDTGADGSHVDLEDAIVHNVKVVSDRYNYELYDIIEDAFVPYVARGHLSDANRSYVDAFVPLLNTDVGGGHGTHVAGIVASRDASGAGAKGVAPGASLHVFGTGVGALVVTGHTVAAFDWIAKNHDQVDPPIRIVTNSWGSRGEWDPDFIVARYVEALQSEGLLVIFAAGNDASGLFCTPLGCSDSASHYGRGDAVISSAKHPGVIAVANYDDSNSGTRDGDLAPSSSRGLARDQSSWPDISAPGTRILSTAETAEPFTRVSASLVHVVFPIHDGDIRFTLGGDTGPESDIGWLLHEEPVAQYNAHRKAWINGLLGQVPFPQEAANPRFFHDGPTYGPVANASDAAFQVMAGDHLWLLKQHGIGAPVPLQITSPSGTTASYVVRFPCSTTPPACEAAIDLFPAFGGEPADGTWTVTPGRSIPAGFHVDKTGTSMAAPHVAGVAALVLQANPGLTPREVEVLLEDTAYPFVAGASYVPDTYEPTPGGSLTSWDKGHGLVDARAAVEAAIAARS